MPSTLALISEMFRRPAQRATAIAVWMSCFLAGNAAGPLVGGCCWSSSGGARSFCSVSR
ncbi:hypothetical protein NKG94_26955 [Micromonospora sp. M12]